MQKHNVVINDMYSFTKELIDMEKPAGFGADPFHFDKKSLHPDHSSARTGIQSSQ